MVKGLEGIEANLTRLVLQNQREAKQAVTEVSEQFKRQLASKIQVSSKSAEHLKNDIQITGFKNLAQGRVEKDIGFGKDAGWRAHFPDKGTVFQRAQNFEEKTIEEMKPMALKRYQEAVKRGLNL